jgi:hypothetical protein
MIMQEFRIEYPAKEEIQSWVDEAVNNALAKIGLLSSNNTNEEQLLNRKEIASVLRVSLVTLNKYQKLGLPYRKVHGKPYFLKSEVINAMTKLGMKK